MDSSQVATIAVVLPESRTELEQLVVAIIENTPEDLFQVILVDTGAPAEVLQFTEALGGDVSFVSAIGSRASDGVIKALESLPDAAFVVAFAHGAPTLTPGWLQAAMSVPNPSLIAGPKALVVQQLHAPTAAPEPPVLRDMGEHFGADLNELMNAVNLDRSSVGALPMAPAERIRERLAMENERHLLEVARAGRDVCWTEPDDVNEPLITVRIATYNRGQTVADVAIASVLEQTYENWELVVVGDHCDEATESAVRSVGDKRIRFFNLPTRGVYPEDKWLRWLVAGAPPVNFALQVAQGSWIAPLDDDDSFTPDHLEVLIREAKSRRLEMVWSKAEMEVDRPGNWTHLGAEPYKNNVSQGTVLYSAGLRFLKMSETCWRQNEPADGNMWRRMDSIGVRMGFVDYVTYRHYLEARYRENMSGPGT